MAINANMAYYKLQGIDVNSVQQVSNQILNNANKTNNQEVSVKALDLSKFNRATLGVDLYSSRTTPELQKQISLMQAGLYTQAVNVAKLNANAAANLYSASFVQKNVELTQSVLSNELNLAKTPEKLDNKIELFDIRDKQSRSSNGFNPFKKDSELVSENQKEV